MSLIDHQTRTLSYYFSILIYSQSLLGLRHKTSTTRYPISSSRVFDVSGKQVLGAKKKTQPLWVTILDNKAATSTATHDWVKSWGFRAKCDVNTLQMLLLILQVCHGRQWPTSSSSISRGGVIENFFFRKKKLSEREKPRKGCRVVSFLINTRC